MNLGAPRTVGLFDTCFSIRTAEFGKLQMFSTIPTTAEQCLLLLPVPIWWLLLSFLSGRPEMGVLTQLQGSGVELEPLEHRMRPPLNKHFPYLTQLLGLSPRPQRSFFNCGIPWKAVFKCPFSFLNLCLSYTLTSSQRPQCHTGLSQVPPTAPSSTISTSHSLHSQEPVTLPVCPHKEPQPQGGQLTLPFPPELPRMRNSYFVLYRCIIP